MAAFVVAYLLIGFPIKVTGTLRTGRSLAIIFYALAPCCSPLTWERSPKLAIGAVRAALRTAGFWVLVCAIAYIIHWRLVETFSPSLPLRSYMAMLPFYAFSEAFAALLRLFFLPFGRVMCPVHARPLLAPTLAQYWGRRWNRWVSDWLRHLIFTPLLRRPKIAAMAVFACSGLWHELVLSLPYSLACHTAIFGSMTAFFLIQGIALLAEPRFLRRHAALRRLYAWGAVVIPAPLLLNEAFLWVFML